MSEPALELAHNDSHFDIVIPAFYREQLRIGKVQNTIRAYGYGLRDMVAFMRASGVEDLSHVTRDLLWAWQDQLLERHLRAYTRSSYSSAARLLFRWAALLDMVDWKLERAIASVRLPKNRKKRKLPLADVKKLVAWAWQDLHQPTLTELRDRALIVYLLVSGKRISEALQVMRHDYVSPMVIQKGGSETQIHTSPSALDLVNRYLRKRKDESPWLWITHGNNVNASGNRMSADAAREVCKRAALELGLKQFSPHRLRHTSTSWLANKHVSPAVIASWMGHANLQTVYEYIEIDEPALQEISDRMEELVGPAPRPLPPATRSWRDYRR